MGMYDTVVLLDQELRCPAGHALDSFQTKGFPDPSMDTYLIEGGSVFRAVRGLRRDEAERAGWRIEGREAVHERRYVLESVSSPREVLIYTHCEQCDSVLVRNDKARLWGDIVDEHRLFVEARLTFPAGEPVQIERVTGSRADLAAELRAAGLRVLDDDEPLAVAHREIKRARSGSAS